MALRKPLVLINNRPQECPPEDTLDAQVGEVDIVNKVNGNAGAITICQPVYVKSDGNVDKARANASGTARVLGLVKDASVSASATGAIQTDGLFVATTTEWDAVTGETGGLTPGAEYIVSPDTAGNLIQRESATIDAGEFIVPVLLALSTTEADLNIGEIYKRN